MNERCYLKPSAVASVNREEDIGLNSTLKEEADAAMKTRRDEPMTQEKQMFWKSMKANLSRCGSDQWSQVFLRYWYAKSDFSGMMGGLKADREHI